MGGTESRLESDMIDNMEKEVIPPAPNPEQFAQDVQNNEGNDNRIAELSAKLTAQQAKHDQAALKVCLEAIRGAAIDNDHAIRLLNQLAQEVSGRNVVLHPTDGPRQQSVFIKKVQIGLLRRIATYMAKTSLNAIQMGTMGILSALVRTTGNQLLARRKWISMILANKYPDYWLSHMGMLYGSTLFCLNIEWNDINLLYPALIKGSLCLVMVSTMIYIQGDWLRENGEYMNKWLYQYNITKGEHIEWEKLFQTISINNTLVNDLVYPIFVPYLEAFGEFGNATKAIAYTAAKETVKNGVQNMVNAAGNALIGDVTEGITKGVKDVIQYQIENVADKLPVGGTFLKRQAIDALGRSDLLLATDRLAIEMVENEENIEEINLDEPPTYFSGEELSESEPFFQEQIAPILEPIFIEDTGVHLGIGGTAVGYLG
jgi:hypothetical protein